MATGRLTDIVKARRESGEGVASSLVGGFKERLKEKFDLRRALPQGGLLTALFPKLSSYKAQGLVPKKDEMSSDTKPGISAGDSVTSLKPLFLSIEKSTKTISKNNASLVSIEKDTNLMKQTLSAIVKVMSGRKNPFASTEDTVPSKLPDEPKDDDGIISTILSAVASIKLLIESVIGFIRNIIGTFVKNFLPILRTISQFALRFIPLLGSLPVLITALAALAAYSIFRLGSDYKKGRETQSDLILLRQKKKAGTATPEELKRLEQLEAEGVTATPGEAKQMAAVRGAANTGLPILKQLEKQIKSGERTEKEANDVILESTGFDLPMLREFKKANESDPKINNDLITFAAKKGVISAKAKNVSIREQTPEAIQAAIVNRTVGFGDEITATLIKSNQLGDGEASTSAKSPTAVLASIESYAKKNAKTPNILENKTIFLSTGFENSKGLMEDLPIVEKQISILKSLGASDNAIKLIGVTEKSKNATEINAGLSEIASRNDNEFIPIQNKKLGKTFVKDIVVPNNTADIDDQESGKAIAAALAAPAAPPSASTGPSLDNSGAQDGPGNNPMPSSTSPGPMPATAIDNSGAQDGPGNNPMPSSTSPIPAPADTNINVGEFQAVDSVASTNALLDDLDTSDRAAIPKETNNTGQKIDSASIAINDGNIGEFDKLETPAAAPSPGSADGRGDEGNGENGGDDEYGPVDFPYNDMHPQYNSLTRALLGDLGIQRA